MNVGGTNRSLTYSSAGNLLSFDGWTYQYDHQNRLTRAAKSGTTVSLTYDPIGRLSTTNHNGSTIEYLYDGDELVAEYNSSGTLLRRYIHGLGVDDPVIRYDGAGTGSRRYLHSDERGSIIAETNASGGILTSHRYGPYGEPINGSTSRFRYTGQALIPGTELYHYKARVYHPTLGRFLQTDPVGYADQMNLYAYVRNDPVNMTDPTGEFGIIGALIGGGIDAAIQIGNNMKNGQGFGDAVMNVDLGSVAVSAALGAVTGDATTLLKGAVTGTTKVGGATVQLTSTTERIVAGSLGANKAAAAGFVQAERKGKDGLQGAAAQVVNGVTSPVPVGTMIMEGAAMLTGSDEQSTPTPKTNKKLER